MRATAQQPRRAPDGAPVQYECHRPEQTTLHRPVQQHAASFIAHTEASTGAELPRFIKDEIAAFLECGILAHGFVRLRCGERGHDRLLAQLQAPRVLPIMRRAPHEGQNPASTRSALTCRAWPWTARWPSRRCCSPGRWRCCW